MDGVWTPGSMTSFAAKLIVLREKDVAYTNALVRAGFVDLGILAERLHALPASVHADRVKTALDLVEDGVRDTHRADTERDLTPVVGWWVARPSRWQVTVQS